ncbi:uncharacterized protein LOC125785518 [Astyanax mexicanus]|uniref:uncharacterized protein LOC125785518 n=1 Tax=Astyanax mexicanus TaxID=7994 RepID=UPI0020CAFF56|nr:uncharacterized protein LOC125785518 [Astyanax mexicanus]
MGGGWSEEEKEKFAAELFQSVQGTSVMPDIGIDYSILKYSGLNSSSALDDYSSQLIDLSILGYMKDLGSALSNFNNVPNAVGLGALLISILLDTMIGLKKTEDEANVSGMMRRVFAEEKASDVRDFMDEYIKRFSLKMHNPEELLYETKRLEEQLSNGLTRLRNSMLHDNQISTRSMKHWTNGAAFHLQMFIHKARMEVGKSERSSSELNRQVLSVGELAEHYGNDMKNLLTKYEAYKRSTIQTITDKQSVLTLGEGAVMTAFNSVHFDTELNTQAGLDRNYMFKNWNLLKELREYFPSIKQNLKETIMQNTTFSIEKFLPAPERNDRTDN